MLECEKCEIVIDALIALKREIHDKAIYPHIQGVDSYIGLKVFDAVIQRHINNYTERKNENKN